MPSMFSRASHLNPLSNGKYHVVVTSDGADFANRVPSAMPHEFGGHVEKPAEDEHAPGVTGALR